ncbi:multiple sugar ABC transporter [Vibrio variabilis]|uniref:Multiple sugar ABC transporter n=1 Tax=Vibrio variabilis TaxID=990271 RepID=A0ABQ0J8Y0_9VIBR|nr:multiple sugar ABC transporter [Vibrio variabilis]
MRAEIKRLHHRLGVTSVYVTHDQVEAMTLADRIVVMSNGKIEQIGTPMELFNSPVNTFVATFIGSPPMNLIEARASFHEDVGTLSLKRSNASCQMSQVLSTTRAFFLASDLNTLISNLSIMRVLFQFTSTL